MKAINVDDFIFDLDRIKAIVSSDSRTASLIEKLQYMIIEYERRHPIEAEPVRHGKWEAYPSDGYMRCSNCRVEYLKMKILWSYCPHCGAKMDLED